MAMRVIGEGWKLMDDKGHTFMLWKWESYRLKDGRVGSLRYLVVVYSVVKATLDVGHDRIIVDVNELIEAM